ncbi:RAVE protein 1 C terminal, putative [Trypanosoma equiperdum]|uniref:RAVE protein 1 C terminal, putative n=1 Tax=Trypanosoma equiperdum TaxID=5694 RepID=A0A1G4I0R6_TRYEQ|nr:RAVE protein 1 C terminal, putative [Trypanosoma equiperdum]
MSLSGILFPQRCHHAAHAFSSRGELWTALVTDHNFLVLRGGTLCASGPLSAPSDGDGAGFEAEAHSDLPEPPPTPLACRICCSERDDDIRVIVISMSGVYVVDVTGPRMQMTYHSLCVCGGIPGCSRATVHSSPNEAQMPVCLSEWSHTQKEECARKALDAEFVTSTVLVIAYSDAVELIELSWRGRQWHERRDRNEEERSRGVMRWRVRGSYSKLAVCRVSMYLSVSQRSSLVEVFPLQPRLSDQEQRTEQSTVSFPPVLHAPREACVDSFRSLSYRTPTPSLLETAEGSAYVWRGASTRLCNYKITSLEWHRVSGYSLLCVTCHESDRGQPFIVFFIAQLCPVHEGAHVRAGLETQHGSGMVGVNSSTVHEVMLTLVPAGKVPHSSISGTPLSVHIVPNYICSHSEVQGSDKLELLCVEKDGSVFRSSYCYDPHQGNCLVRCSSTECLVPQLLGPIQKHYGDITTVDVLPAWRPRAVAFGPLTPAVAALLEAQRYRLVLRFRNGMVARVVVDLAAATVRVEAFLTLGVDAHPPLLATAVVDGVSGPQQIVLGLTQDRLFVVRRTLFSGGLTEASVSVVGPLALEHLQKLVCGSSVCGDDDAGNEMKGNTCVEESEALRSFMQAKCPEKLHMLPVLLKACGGDARKLLRQLTAKYGSPTPAAFSDKTILDEGRSCDGSGDRSKNGRFNSVTPSLLPSALKVGALRLTTGGIRCCVEMSVKDTDKPHHHQWWYIPATPLASVVGEWDSLIAHGVLPPSTALVQCLDAPLPAELLRERRPSRDGLACVSWSTSAQSLVVQSRLLPHETPLKFRPFESMAQPYNPVRVDCVKLVNNVIVVCVMGATRDEEIKTVLMVYVLDALRDVATQPVFEQELVIHNVATFFMCDTGGLFVLRRDSKSIVRWMRVTTNGVGSGHCWREYCVRGGSESQEAITTMAPLYTKSSGMNCHCYEGASCTHFVYVSSEEGLIKVCETSPKKDLRSALKGEIIVEEGGSCPYTEVGRTSTRCAKVELYHPTVITLLLAMHRPRVARAALEGILESAAEASVASQSVDDSGPRRVAEVLCQNSTKGPLDAWPVPAATEEIAGVAVRTHQLEGGEEENLCDYAAAFGLDIPLELLDQMTEVVMHAKLRGLSSQEQLTLLCTVESLRAVRVSGVANDAGASRCLFSHKFLQLQQRRRAAVASAESLPANHTSFLWAALSDCQPQLLDVLSATDGNVLSWANVEVSGVPFWLDSVHRLRAIAERVAREQYQRSRDVRECALMYCLARKPGVISALCRTCGNTKLEMFFSRDFNEAKNRSAASANAFAAVSKNLIEYGAAFFVLAAEPRNAAQVLLQREGNVSLALFLIRIATDDNPDDLSWFIEQRRLEETSCGAMSKSEEACLLWRGGRKHEALSLLTVQAPLHVLEGADRLALLKFARRRTGAERGPAQREMLRLLMHTVRLSHAAGMRLPTSLFCQEALSWLLGLSKEDAGDDPTAQGNGSAANRVATSGIVADFNSGTLAFNAFDMDGDDGERGEMAASSQSPEVAVASPMSEAVSVPTVRAGAGEIYRIDPAIVYSLLRELDFIREELQNSVSTQPQQQVQKHQNTAVCDILSCAARLLVAVGGRDPAAGAFSCLQQMLECLPQGQWGKSCVDRLSESPRYAEGEGNGMGLCTVIIALRVSLMSVATYNKDCALATALLGLPMIDDILLVEGAQTVTVNTIAVYVRTVCHVLENLRSQTAEWAQEEEKRETSMGSDMHGVDGSESLNFALYNPFEGSGSAGSGVRPNDNSGRLRNDKLRAMLLVWCTARLHLSALKELLLEASGLRSASQDSQSTQVALQQWLVSYMLCRVTLDFNAAAVQFVGDVVSVLQLRDPLPADPNGVFIEVEQQLLQIAGVLGHSLPTATSLLGDNGVCESCGQQQRYVDLLKLCVSHSEVFCQTTTCNTSLSGMTESALTLLSNTVAPRTVENLLHGRLVQGTKEALRFVEATWLQRHLTRHNYREQFLSPLREGPSVLRRDESLVLQQCGRAVTSVDYDRSSHDVIVWATAADVSVRGGYCGMLSRPNDTSPVVRPRADNGGPSFHPTREGGVTGLSPGGSSREGVLFGSPIRSLTKPAASPNSTPGSDRKLLSRRPSLPLLDGSRVAAHPRLPFFSAPHLDGCIDFYSFTAAECVKTFDCGDSRAVTGVAYSTDGCTFVAGLEDGSVRGWRFDLQPVDRAVQPLFVYHVLPTGGIRTVMFCGASQSHIAVIGFSYDSLATGQRNPEEEEGVCGLRGEPKPASAKPKSKKGLLGFPRFGNYERNTTELLLLVDLVLRPGTFAWQELSVVPEHAVYIKGLDSIMCISTNGAVALYDMWSSRLYTFVRTPNVTVTCVAASYHDDIVAVGLVDGAVLLLHSNSIRGAVQACNGSTSHVASECVAEKALASKESLLLKASRLQLIPSTSPRCDVHSVVFTPSVMLAGLGDGRVLAVGFPFSTIKFGKA